MGKYFGTDGIRGKAYEQLTFELAFNLGKSLLVLHRRQLVIACDTRESSSMLVDAVKQGAKISGIDVLDLGVQPTPKLSYISRKQQAIGVMVTASHNPYHDNGIKVFDAGEKLFEERELAIESAMDGNTTLEKPIRVGKDLPAIADEALYHSLFSPFLQKTPFRIGIDLANGATVATAEKLFSEVAKELVVLSNHPDGKNINVACGSTHPEALIHTVLSHQLDLGFAFDGDGDRVICIGKDGRLYDGDMMIYAIARSMKEQGHLKNSLVILTKMSNLGIIKAFKKHRIEVTQTQVGDKYVLEEMLKSDAVIGGEASGHIINRALLDTGDGVLNAIYLTHLLALSNTTLEEITKDVSIYPDKLVNLRGVDKTLAKHPLILELVAQIEQELGSDGYVLVRPSGTEPLLRISASAKTKEQVEDIIARIVETIESLSQGVKR